MQADSIIPLAGQGTQAFDRYAYVNNSPVNFNDPSGHDKGISLHDSFGDSNDFAAMNVNLASSIPKETAGAQVISIGGQIQNALCGQVAISMIYETITKKDYTLNKVVENLNDFDGTTLGQLASLVTNLFPDGWGAASYSNAAIYEYWNGYNHVTYLDHKWYVDKEGKNCLFDITRQILKNGHFLIASVVLDDNANGALGRLSTTGVLHWVVVTGMVGNYIRINDPYSNIEVWYTWEQFFSSAAAGGYGYLEIYDPANQKPEPREQVVGGKL